MEIKSGNITMRDTLIKNIYSRMAINKSIFFVSADFGAPTLDKLRQDFKDRFINVGIAEQNLINVSTGLALEGFTVYAYAIAPFLTMRAFEQIRNNLSLLAQTREVNVNMIGVGAGSSYDVSGPSHFCLEDLSLIRTLPNITVISPSDSILVEKFVEYSIVKKNPKYFRLDSKPLPEIYTKNHALKLDNGFYELIRRKETCIVSTGYMTHKAIKVSQKCLDENIDIGVIDVFMLRPLKKELFYRALKKYKNIITLEDGFVDKGGLDGLVSTILNHAKSNIRIERMGFRDSHIFDVGSREYLHELNNLDEKSIIQRIKDLSQGKK